MRCPQCDKRTRVTATRSQDSIRYRKCDCGHNFKTKEVSVDFDRPGRTMKRPPPWLNKAKELRAQGLFCRQIAEKLERYYPVEKPPITKEGVRRWLLRAGMPARVRKPKPPVRKIKLIPYAGAEPNPPR